MSKGNSYYEMNRDVFKNFVARERESVKSIGEAFRKKHVFISQGNKKVGDVPSVSLLPVIDCGNCSKCKRSCYDLRHDIIMKECLRTRAVNSLICKHERERYFAEIDDYLAKHLRPAFRFHIGGDIVDDDYFARMVELSRKHRKVDFLVFTKMFHVVNGWIGTNGDLPPNLHVIFSGWIGLKMDNPYNLPTAHPIIDGVTSAPDGAKYCTGNCTECYKEDRMCWTMGKGESILFAAH